MAFSFFRSYDRGLVVDSPLYCLEILVSPRAITFGWLVFRRSILTSDNLYGRKGNIVNAFSMCLVDEETVDPLIFQM